MFQTIYTASFLMAFSGFLVSTSTSFFLAQIKHSGALIIGLAGFTATFTHSIITFVLSRYSKDKPNVFFIYAPLVMGIVYCLISFSTVPLIFLLLIVGGSCNALFWPSSQKCLSGADDFEIGIYNLSWGSGGIAGTFLSGFIYSLSPSLPFFTVLFIYTIVFILLISQKGKLLGVDNKPLPARQIEKALSLETANDIRILNFIHFFASGAVFYLYPKLGLLRGFTPQIIGSMIGILFISRLITFLLLMDKPLILHPAKFVIGTTFFGISCILVGYGKNPFIIVLGVIILGSTGALAYHNSLLMHIKYNLKTEIHECIIGAGVFSGSLVAGCLGQIFNLPVAYLIIGTSILLSGLLCGREYLFRLVKCKSGTR
ncbi:MAG: hypothetical protein NC832_00265 [Candidatus Omnitrophica bacterium]|nr:hypothetical protein [Candidatus Omnitrophota bacterium]